VNRLALTISGLGFFVLAVVGWNSGASPLTVALRAAGGAAALYVMLRLAGMAVIAIAVETIVQGPAGGAKTERTRDERSD
jgi:hypothetical protein